MSLLNGNNEPFNPARINPKTITIDTGANLAGITPTVGKFVFATTTGGGFTANNLYVYDGSAWALVALAALAQTLTGLSLDCNSNTVTLAGSCFAAGAVTAAKLGAITALFQSSQSGSPQTTTSASYVDLLSMTFTANGGRAGLLTKFITQQEIDAGSSTDVATFALTDGSNTVLHENQHSGFTHYYYASALQLCLMESAPSAGSLTRKVRWKTTGGTLGIAQLSGGYSMFSMEVP